MSKTMIVLLGVLAAGMVQFGILASVAGAQPIVIIAGTIGAMGTTLAGLLKQLPRPEWTDEQRKEQA